MYEEDVGICLICGRVSRGSLLCDDCEEKQPDDEMELEAE